MALTQPGRVRQLAVLSVGFPGTVFCANPKQRELSWYMLFFQHPEAEALLAADDWALMRQLLGKNSSEAKVQDYIDALSQPGALTAGLSWYRANLDLAALAATKPTLPPAKLNMLVMGLWSDGEAYLTEEGMTASRDVVTGGLFFYKRIEGAGHWMMRDAPAKVNAALADFVGAGLDPDVSMYADLM
uniref:AB hydrolase-1 domain-containing protein n=1 Tax=Tetradesmus obliquus TaxID=3088 RepID=A0A383VB90_TETOB|eukprot:jgi/Sobl393_1/18195/SZX62213.1